MTITITSISQCICVTNYNILEAAKNNFKKYKVGYIDSLGFPYDYLSVMHYGQYTFSKHYRTPVLVTTDPKMQSVIGQREGFSKIDKLQINALYKCSGKFVI